MISPDTRARVAGLAGVTEVHEDDASGPVSTWDARWRLRTPWGVRERADTDGALDRLTVGRGDMDLQAAEVRGQAGQWPDGAAYVDGRFVPVGEARIPITEWGYRRSDVTYDVVGVWDGASSSTIISRDFGAR